VIYIGITLLAVGLLAAFGSFLYALFNMKQAVVSDEMAPGQVFSRHIGAMGGMATGGAIGLIGAGFLITALILWLMEHFA